MGKVREDVDRSGKCTVDKWPKQHLGVEGRMVWKTQNLRAKKSVWKVVTSSTTVIIRA